MMSPVGMFEGKESMWLAMAIILTCIVHGSTTDRCENEVHNEGATQFRVTSETWGKGTKHEVHLRTLSNSHTNEYAQVIVSPGGAVEALELRSRTTKQIRDVLIRHASHGATDEERAAVVHANKYAIGAMLAPFANRIDNGTYSFAGSTHHLPRNEEARGHAIHGFLSSKSLKVIASVATNDSASLTLTHHFGDDPGFPFRLSINITYVLNSTGLSINTFVRNDDGRGLSAPFYHGWHPYFKVYPDVSATKVILDRSCTEYRHVEMWPGDTLIPSHSTAPWASFNGVDAIGGTRDAPTYFDDAFKATEAPAVCPILRTEIRDAHGAAVLWQDSSYRFIQVFTGSKSIWGDEAVACEPQSAKTDAFNNHEHLSILNDGESFSGSFGVYVA